MPFPLQCSGTELLSMIARNMCMLGHPMKWYVQKEALSKSSKTRPSVTILSIIILANPSFVMQVSSYNALMRTEMKGFGRVWNSLQPLPVVCHLPTSASPGRQWISAAASPTCCQGNKRRQKKKKSSMTSNFQAVKTPLTGISAVF